MVQFKTWAKHSVWTHPWYVVDPETIYVDYIHGSPDGEMTYRFGNFERHVTPDDLWLAAVGRWPQLKRVMVAPCYPAAVKKRWAKDIHLVVMGDWDEPTLVDQAWVGVTGRSRRVFTVVPESVGFPAAVIHERG